MAFVSEHVINDRLARMLHKFGMDCRAERVVQRKRPDIRCVHRTTTAIIEASYNGADAEGDARKRIESVGQAHEITTIVALHYHERPRDVPEGELEETVKNMKFRAKAFVRKASAAPIYVENEWVELKGVEELAKYIDSHIEHALGEEKLEETVKEVGEVVGRFVAAASSHPQADSLRQEVADVLYKLYGFSVSETKDAEIVFGQSALILFLSALLYESIRDRRDLSPLAKYVDEKGGIAGLREALKSLQAAGYKTATSAALEILHELPPSLAPAVRNIVDLAIKLAQEPQLLSRDFAGRIYHKITGDIALRKGFATYYTEVPAAYLLAWLAVNEALGVEAKRLSRGEAEKVLKRIEKLKIADFACGSGTLLTASLYAASRIAGILRFLQDLPSLQLERRLAEEGIYGLDALRYAAQISAMNLSLMASAPAKNIYTIYLGFDKMLGAWLGSLELLENPGKVGGLLRYIEGGLRGKVERVSVTATEEGKMELPDSFDVVIMNPPFTRATGRTEERFQGVERGLFGFIAAEEIRERMKKGYEYMRRKINEKLVKMSEELFAADSALAQRLWPLSSHERAKSSKLDQYYAIGQAGEGLLFLYLAYRYVKPGGVIAFVLPRNLLSGVSWFLARALLAHKFHLLYVLVSSDGRGGYDFSESTSLSECLIVARRVEGHSPEEETVFVNLLRKPGNIFEAVRLAEGIRAGRESPTAIVKRVKRGELLRRLDNLNRFAALPESELLDLALRTEEGDLGVAEVPVARLMELTEAIGVDAHQFFDLFKVTDVPTEYPIVYSGKESLRLSISVTPNAFAEPKERAAHEIWENYSSRLLLPDRLGVSHAHAVVLYSQRPTMSNLFYSARLKASALKELQEKALALWLNTTWGLLSFLLNREETQGPWMRLKLGHWKLHKVMDVRALDEDVLMRIARAFDKVEKKQLDRLADQFDLQRVNPVRLEIDLEFLRALRPELDEERVKRELMNLYGRFHTALTRWFGKAPHKPRKRFSAGQPPSSSYL